MRSVDIRASVAQVLSAFIRVKISRNCLGQIGGCELIGLDVDVETVFGGGFGCDGADAGDDDVRKCISEIVGVEELCEVFDRRWACKRDAVSAACKHGGQFPAIDVVWKDCLIRGYDVNARACVLESFGQ